MAKSEADVTVGNSDTEAFSLRLRSLIGTGSVNAFALKCGLSETLIRMYLKGSVPGLDKVLQIANATGVSVDWLATGKGRMRQDEWGDEIETAGGGRDRQPWVEVPSSLGIAVEGADERTVVLPRLAVQLSGGPGAVLSEENVIGRVVFSRDWLRERLSRASPTGLAIVGVTGDSMEPTIREGDDVMVDTGVTRFLDNAIYAMLWDDALVVKRLQRTIEGLVVISDNPAYGPQVLSRSDAEQLQIIGRVRWVGRLL